MFSLTLMFSVAFLYKICETSQANTSIEIHYKAILNSLNVSELNFTSLDILLKRLHIDNCSTTSTKQLGCGEKCLTPDYLYNVSGHHNHSAVIGSRSFHKLSTILLFSLLPEKNAGPKNCQNGVVPPKTSYRRFLEYYQTTGLICARLLVKILRDINETFKDSVTKPCLSVVDLFKEVHLSAEHDELDVDHFSTIGVVIISHLLRRHCISSSQNNHDLENLPCKSFFTSNLVAKFGGEDGSIPVKGFEKILENLGLGKLNHDEADGHGHRKKREIKYSDTLNISYSKQCYYSHDLLDIFSVNSSIGFDTNSFKEICPSLVQQLVSKACVEAKKEEHDDKTHSKYVWLYGFASVLIISLLSLVGIAIIPTMKGQMYKKIIIVLVGLAIGTLAGDALLHLIPHAAGFHATSHGHESERGAEGKTFIWKFLVVASGVYGFFLFETFTHLFLRTGGHGHSHNNMEIEHTRKHSPFERNNSCRTVERHEMRLASSAVSQPVDNTDLNQVIINKVTGASDGKNYKSTADDLHEDNIPNILTESSHGHEKKISSVGWMIIIGDTIHNITDGIAIGAAFSEDIGGGLSTSIAVFCHELPHELGDFAVLISSGMTVKQAMLANFLSACSSFIGLVIGLLIGGQTEGGNQWVFAVMGGMFLYIALVDMLPELMHSEELGGAGAGRLQIFMLQNLGMLTGFMIMLCISFFEEDLVLPV